MPAKENTNVRAEIVRMTKEGKSYGQIARTLGLSRGTVGGHLSRERHKSPVSAAHDPYTAKEDAMILRMRAEGSNCGEIARELGRPYEGIRKRGSIYLGIVWDRKPQAYGNQHTAYKLENEDSLRIQDAAFVNHLHQAFQNGEFPK